mgnify:CR=1 FL=1|jgi:hypothetical protein
MFVWKKVHIAALAQLEKVQSIANAYGSVLREIGDLLVLHGADPRMGIVQAIQEFLPELPVEEPVAEELPRLPREEESLED